MRREPLQDERRPSGATPSVEGPGEPSRRDAGAHDQRPAPAAQTAPPSRVAKSGLIDWRRLGRRLRVTAVALAAGAVALWVAMGLIHGAVRLRDLWGYVGLALAGLFAAEIVLVGGAALRGMFRAGERGERLAGNDVGLLPPQLHRRR